jgi:hypothetical protein
VDEPTATDADSLLLASIASEYDIPGSVAVAVEVGPDAGDSIDDMLVLDEDVLDQRSEPCP